MHQLKKSRSFWSLAISVSLLLSLLVLYPLIYDGMAVTSDSVKYINMAQNVLQRNGISMLGCEGDLRPNTHWAPLFGWMLALPMAPGLHWMTAARIWTLLSCFFMLLLLFLLVYRLSGSLLYSVLAQAVAALHPVLLKHSGSILTEPVAWVILLVLLHVIITFLYKPERRPALWIGGLLGIAMLLRFAFLGFLPGMVLLAFLPARRIGWKRSFGYSVMISIIALIPFLLWYLRNVYVGSGLADEGTGGNRLLISNAWVILLNGWKILLGFFSAPQNMAWLVIIPPAAVVLPVVFRVRSVFIGQKLHDLVYTGSLLIMAGYAFTMLILRTFSAPVSLDGRMFSPFIFLLIMMAVCVLRRTDEAGSRQRVFIKGLFLLWAVWIVIKGGVAFFQLQERSLYYADDRWKESETLNYALQHLEADEILTSDPEPFWLYGDICVHRLPLRHVAPKRSSQYEYRALVWFDCTNRFYIVCPRDIEWGKNAEQLDFKDGVIYLVNEPH
ncbi:hypothetical protein GF407_00055 [candidate division KSB1 bacterium]|nr:hypothetical protein [candidate division KSB1 bacterium]